MTYFAFDLLFVNGQDLRTLPVIERKAKLQELIGADSFSLRYVAHVEKHGEAMFAGSQKIGMEGVVGKKADSTYQGGRMHCSCGLGARTRTMTALGPL